MNAKSVCAAALVAGGLLVAGGALAADPVVTSSDKNVTVTPAYGGTEATPPDRKSLNYAIGVTTARNLVKDGVDVDIDVIIQGLRDGMSGKLSMLSDTEIRDLMNGLVTSMRQKFTSNRRNQEDGNRKRGNDYMAAFAKEPGVRRLPDGVLVQELEAGHGPVPSADDEVQVSYRGTLVDGKEFDATLPSKPASLPLSRVIPGWRAALTQMPVGAHWKVVIPPDEAYGERGIGSMIGPNETLVFDLHLVAIGKK